MAHKVTLIPGDGSGPEVVAAAKRVVEATGVAIEWDEMEAGAAMIEKYRTNCTKTRFGMTGTSLLDFTP